MSEEATNKPKLETVEPITTIAKPAAFDLSKFKSKRALGVADVETRPTELPHHNLAAAKDWARLHWDEENYWTDELCFVNVPIKGQKSGTLHLINEDLALEYLSAGRLLFFRLALASKPFDVFFLCHVPTRNLDNAYNSASRQACEDAKTLWTQAVSLKLQGLETYKIEHARNQKFAPEPNWLKLSLGELVGVTFPPNLQIMSDDHPGLLRLIGEKQNLA
jgi:hypothetical protein